MSKQSPDPAKQLAGRIGGNTRWSLVPKADRPAQTLPARTALEEKWLREADGDPARAANLKRLHFAKMALISAQARRKPRLLRKKLEAVQAELAEAEAAELDEVHGDDAA